VTLADDLSATFLFESLSKEQLGTLAALGTEARFDAGETIFVEGQPAEFLWVLLAGEMELLRHIGGQRIRIATASRPGTYGGGIQAFSGSAVASGYRATAKALQPARFFRLPSSELGRLLADWSPVAKHLLDGYLQRLESIEATVRERERLISLGRLAAGLAHEVNNPAAAAIRATADLRLATHQLQNVVGWLAGADLPRDRIRGLLSLQNEAVSAVRPPAPGAIELANAEDEIGAWLDRHGVDNSWSLASTFTLVGLGESWLDRASHVLGVSELSPGLNWISATLLTTSLVDQIDNAVGRIAQLVAAVKEYSYMDRAPEQEVNVHEGIEKTLLVLGHKLRPGIQIVRGYDEHLPAIQANGAELNQVWTNLIDNAIDALDGSGQILIRTRHDDDDVFVEIADKGPGIPTDLVSRIFDPFFTTKEVGKGTGLGLDIVRRIVVDAHHGEISVESTPGDTSFIVRLPIT
jgi:signal transduction histidine kinase